MASLFGSLHVARNSLQNMHLGISVTGHNMANATTEGYTRQRVLLQAEKQIDDKHILGMGAEAREVQRVHDALLDKRIQVFKSDNGLLEAQKEMLDLIEANLGQVIDRQSQSIEGRSAIQGIGSPSGIAEYMDEFFTSVSALTADPTSSPLRQQLVAAATSLSDKFNSNGLAINDLQEDIKQDVENNISDINQLIDEITHLNNEIIVDENREQGLSNDLRDRRQLRVEELSNLIDIQTEVDGDGMLNVLIGGHQMTGRKTSENYLESYLNSEGKIQIRTKNEGEDISISSGRVAGLMRVRDETLSQLESDFNKLASTIITEINNIYSSGFDLRGGTGKVFFSGTDANDINIDSDIVEDPSLIQGSGDGSHGGNEIFLKLFEISQNKFGELGNQTLSEKYADLVGGLGQTMKTVETAIVDNNAIGTMLDNKRESVRGVSLDEEMTNLIQFQRAYQASARMINIIDEMVTTAIGLGA